MKASVSGTIDAHPFEKDMIICTESTITQNTIVYYHNSDVTSKFSHLLNDGNDDYIFNLFDKSLYVSKIILLSMSKR